ncbi:hypothetical protein PCASD_12029 [Puccinia coronata f. sp. avenae]|uniref:No apical meristem-associated C-terminal domain-containing protein n=1 Tax=Puccinia coronata f. sp. avenae TaxID=200324 RepID=A0A2N5TBY5_9BASI|nr:hypothetical protein PCASD_12029 [Puccinia coronata f. sp. avenae]
MHVGQNSEKKTSNVIGWIIPPAKGNVPGVPEPGGTGQTREESRPELTLITSFTPDYDIRIARFWKEMKVDGIMIYVKGMRERLELMLSGAVEFSSVYHQAKNISVNLGNPNPSDAKLVDMAKEQFYRKTGKQFQFESSWHILRQHPEWMKNVVNRETSPSKTRSASSYNPADDSPDDAESIVSASEEQTINSTQRRTSLRLAALAAQGTPTTSSSAPTARTSQTGNSLTRPKSIHKPPTSSIPPLRPSEPRFTASCSSQNPHNSNPPALSTSSPTVVPLSAIAGSKCQPICIEASNPTHASHSSLPQLPSQEPFLTPSKAPITTTETDTTPEASKRKIPQTDLRCSGRKRSFDELIQMESCSGLDHDDLDEIGSTHTILASPQLPLPELYFAPSSPPRTLNQADRPSSVARVKKTPPDSSGQSRTCDELGANKTTVSNTETSRGSINSEEIRSRGQHVDEGQPERNPVEAMAANTTDRPSSVSRVKNSPSDSSAPRCTCNEIREAKTVLIRETPRGSINPDEIRSGSQHIDEGELELKRMEATSERDRIELEIMKKDLRTCTDKYEKEYFLVKKRKILARLTSNS